MATKPNIAKLTATSPEIMNTIRSDASAYYRDMVPRATNNSDSIKEIGGIIMQYQALQNEFLSALVNRIGRVLITSRMFDNPWSMFKKGLLEYGETVEEIFVNICNAQQFNPSVAETNVFKREIPDVKAAFHVMNYQKFYKQTISDDQLRQAFLSWQGITDLIARIVDAMYTAANYDEFQVMKYMIAKNIINGNFYPVQIQEPSTANARAIASSARKVSNNLTFLGTQYNPAGVYTSTPRDDQFIIVNTAFDAIMSVEVLATSFNMTEAEFFGHRVLVDGFGNLDAQRLNELLADNPGYEEIGSDDLAALNDIPAIIVDRNWFMIFDNLFKFTEIYNGEGLYWNYFYHVWKTFSVSPFANAVMLNNVAAAITSVSVNPSAVTVNKGNTSQFTANVVTTGFAPKDVTWSINSTLSNISSTGLLTVAANETASSITVTATSKFDGKTKGTATVTVPA